MIILKGTVNGMVSYRGSGGSSPGKFLDSRAAGGAFQCFWGALCQNLGILATPTRQGLARDSTPIRVILGTGCDIFGNILKGVRGEAPPPGNFKIFDILTLKSCILGTLLYHFEWVGGRGSGRQPPRNFEILTLKI